MKSLHPVLCACLASCMYGAAALSQQPAAAPQEGTQPPAPIVRPKASVPRPASPIRQSTPALPAIPNIPDIVAPKPRAARPPSGATGTTAPATQTLPAKAPSSTSGPASTQTTGVSVRQFAPGTAAVLFNRTTIVLDPSHGGIDGGSRISDTLQEKDVDLAFANKLRSLLTARGFNVVLTRESDAATPPDSGTPLKLDDRAGIANHVHPVACLLIHSTGSGKGVHLYSSELAPVALQPTVVPWLTAQASWVSVSRALQKQLGTAISREQIPLVMSRASIRPLDSMACPALALELAPEGSDKDSVNEAGYQQRVANAIASVMVFWQNQAQPPDRQLPALPVTPAAPLSVLPSMAAPVTPTGVHP